MVVMNSSDGYTFICDFFNFTLICIFLLVKKSVIMDIFKKLKKVQLLVPSLKIIEIKDFDL